jgi:hypothetical protein
LIVVITDKQALKTMTTNFRSNNKKNSTSGESPKSEASFPRCQGFLERLFCKKNAKTSDVASAEGETASLNEAPLLAPKSIQESWQATPSTNQEDAELPGPSLSKIVPVGLSVAEKRNAFRGYVNGAPITSTPVDTCTTLDDKTGGDEVSSNDKAGRMRLLTVLVVFWAIIAGVWYEMKEDTLFFVGDKSTGLSMPTQNELALTKSWKDPFLFIGKRKPLDLPPAAPENGCQGAYCGFW